MTWEELKERIGGKAKDIIADDRCAGHDRPICFMTVHKKGNVQLKWLDDCNKYKCFDCDQCYDSLDHARWLTQDNNDEAYKLLCEWAGETPQQGQRKPPQVLQMPKVIAPPPTPAPIQGVQLVSKQLQPVAKQYLVSRGISVDTLKAYKVTSTQDAIYFNYIVSGSVVKIKGRRIGEWANGKEKYSPTPKGGTNVLYGQHLFANHSILAICEGEIDALSLFDGMKANDLDKTVLCSSIPSGSSSTNWIANSIEFIKKFEKVILIPDNDEAGVKFLEKAASELMLIKAGIFSFDLSKHNVNDINELMKEWGTKVFKGIIANSTPYLPDFVIDLAKLPKKPTTRDYVETGFWSLDKKLRGLKIPGISIFSGKSGEGKTTILRQIIKHNNMKCERVGVIMGEEDEVTFRDMFMVQHCKSTNPELFNIVQDKYKNTEYIPSLALLNMFDEHFAPYIGFFDCRHLQNPITRFVKTCEWIRYESTIHNTRLIIIDNLMKFTGGTKEVTTSLQQQLINELYNLVNALGMHIILVAHPNKTDDHPILKEKNVSGASELINTIDNLFIFQRFDKMHDEDAVKYRNIISKNGKYENVTGFINLIKNRWYGDSGFIPMRYDPSTNNIHDLNFSDQVAYKYGYTVAARCITPPQPTEQPPIEETSL